MEIFSRYGKKSGMLIQVGKTGSLPEERRGIGKKKKVIPK